MKLIITPNDTLNFGRGKPSAKGEESFLAEMFPPYPSVFLGALRGLYLSMNPEDTKKANQTDDPTLGFTIKHYSLMLKNNLYFPAPTDYVWYDNSLHTLQLKKNEQNKRLSSLTLPYYLWTDHNGKVAPTEGRWVSIDTLRSYISDTPDNIDSVKLSDYYDREAHVGIARSIQTRTVEQSMLYNINMTRVKDLKFAIETDTDGKMLQDNGLLKLGSHNKSARYESNDFNCDIPPQIGSIFKLYLATPAIFRLGWKPDIEESYGLDLIAAAVGGYDNIGGYNMRANKSDPTSRAGPKPMRRAVKAGSVYYYKLRKDTPENRTEIIEKLHGRLISEERKNEGFGLCYIGNVKGEI